MFYREREFYKRNRVRTFLEREVETIQSEHRRLLLKGGDTLNFEKLLIAVGGSPIVPQVISRGHPHEILQGETPRYHHWRWSWRFSG
jgi:NAD(P)H-nitrite reductase large subunit